MPQTAFISGPLDPTLEYFNAYYRERILTAVRNGDSIVIGPVAGIDTLALHFLLTPPDPSDPSAPPELPIDPKRITIHMTHTEFSTTSWRQRYVDLGVNIHEEGVTTRDRDAAMTRESDYDILRYRTEEEAKELYGKLWWPRVSNTEVNERRRRGITSLAYRLDGEGKCTGEGGDGIVDGVEVGRKGEKEEEEKKKKRDRMMERMKRMFGGSETTE